jgi:hypothetical protein
VWKIFSEVVVVDEELVVRLSGCVVVSDEKKLSFIRVKREFVPTKVSAEFLKFRVSKGEEGVQRVRRVS